MITFLIILGILISILLVLIILIQNPKGGGLSSGFSSSNNIIGVKRTGDFLENGTWGLAIAIMVIAILVNISGPNSGTGTKDSKIQEQIDKTAAPSALPAMPQPSSTDTTKK
ncbi:preprotein translocase subunit SecG [Pelobium manganitolerans]|uniref:Protein-export membrane protein SecG n=1 Tax=Pelobium manganitolerans TaxID=1842495 RepID=A0A419SBQ3_9SPHI|nr:preprotein translocase subunit SecG [Pelobium manganitolerans]RKD20100.1 preprotein translocase subunit SecG [Pelobium manganitolerans]